MDKQGSAVRIMARILRFRINPVKYYEIRKKLAGRNITNSELSEFGDCELEKPDRYLFFLHPRKRFVAVFFLVLF